MSIFDWLGGSASTLPVAPTIAAASVVVLLESVLGLWLFVPAGPVVVVAAAGLDSLPRLLLLFLCVAVARVVGDLVSYSSGRSRADRIGASRTVTKLGSANWQSMAALLRRKGALPVLLSRLVPQGRSLAPAVAGATGVARGRFIGASAVAGLAWSALWVLVGALARAAFPAARPYVGIGPWAVVALLAALGIVYLVGRRLVVRPADGDVRRVLGDSSRAGTTPHPGGPVTSLRERLFEDEWKTLPNVISAVRILLLPLFVVLLVDKHFWSAIITLLVVFVSDFADGFIARRFHQQSALGAWLDPVADRLTVVFVVAAFAASNIVPWQLVVMLLVPDLLSGAWAVVGFHGAPDVRVAPIGKVRTALLFVGLFMMLFGEAVPDFSTVLEGAGFAFFVLGVVGHFMAMTRNARGLVTLWSKPAAA